jgi:hypothetical protein
MIELCGKHGLLIGGTVFSHRNHHKVTWVSPDKYTQVENQMDHICISRNWSKSLLDVHNKSGADIGSDHHMIMETLRIKTQKIKRKTTNRKKYNLKKADDIECQRMLKAKLREGASPLRYMASEGVEEKWEGIKTMLQDICKSTLRLKNKKKSGYLTAHGRWQREGIK